MNKHTPHIFVIPEDEANKEIAIGFELHERVDDRRVKVTGVGRGWKNVLTTFEEEYIQSLRRFPLGHVVMLIDFYGRCDDRLAIFTQAIPDDLRGRVFVVGCSTNPETLRTALGLSFERIGYQLAEDCALGRGGFWDHELLRHNNAERQRLATVVQDFLLIA